MIENVDGEDDESCKVQPSAFSYIIDTREKSVGMADLVSEWEQDSKKRRGIKTEMQETEKLKLGIKSWYCYRRAQKTLITINVRDTSNTLPNSNGNGKR